MKTVEHILWLESERVDGRDLVLHIEKDLIQCKTAWNTVEIEAIPQEANEPNNKPSLLSIFK